MNCFAIVQIKNYVYLFKTGTLIDYNNTKVKVFPTQSYKRFAVLKKSFGFRE